MSHHDDEYLELCAGHALGSLDPPDSVRLQAHLEDGCPVCHAEMEAHRNTVEDLGRSLPPLEPPAELEAKLMERIAPADLPGRRKQSTSSGGTLGRWALRAAALLVLGFAGWQALDSRQEASRLRSENDSLQQVIAGFSEPGVEALHLSGTEHLPGAQGHAYRDSHRTPDPSDDELVLHLTDLKPAGEKEDYHAWLVAGEETHDLGSLRPGEPTEYYVSTPMPRVPGPFQILVTLEPGKAFSRPAGPVLLRYSTPPRKD
jgi:hypothetical protein